ncbi:alcohol dehydrogenase catalytic domain-containing protein [Geodermatophilus sp. URMC 63]
MVVDVERVGVCSTDVELFTGALSHLRTGHSAYPLRPGHEWCGRVTRRWPWTWWSPAAASSAPASPARRAPSTPGRCCSRTSPRSGSSRRPRVRHPRSPPTGPAPSTPGRWSPPPSVSPRSAPCSPGSPESSGGGPEIHVDPRLGV